MWAELQRLAPKPQNAPRPINHLNLASATGILTSFMNWTSVFSQAMVICNKFDLNPIWQNIIKLALASKISLKVWIWSNSLSTITAVRMLYSSSFSFSLVTRSCQGLRASPCRLLDYIYNWALSTVPSATLLHNLLWQLLCTDFNTYQLWEGLYVMNAQLRAGGDAMTARTTLLMECKWSKMDQRRRGKMEVKFFQAISRTRDPTYWRGSRGRPLHVQLMYPNTVCFLIQRRSKLCQRNTICF